MRQPPVPLAIVGFGLRGRQWATLCQRRRDVTVVAVIDPDPLSRERAARRRVPTYPSVDEAVAGGGAGAAILASPPATHAALATTCLEAGLGVLVEKPFALSVASAEAVIREATAAARPALAVQNFRFLPRERAVTKALSSGLGPPVHGSVHSSRSVRSADPLWDFAIHHVDALRVRFGSPPVEVEVSSAAESRVRAALRWPGGVHVEYDHDDAASHYAYRERLDCQQGSVLVDDQRVTARTGDRKWRRVRPPRGPKADAYVLDEFVAALHGRPSPLDARDNLLTLATLEALVSSAVAGRPVSVNPPH